MNFSSKTYCPKKMSFRFLSDKKNLNCCSRSFVEKIAPTGIGRHHHKKEGCCSGAVVSPPGEWAMMISPCSLGAKPTKNVDNNKQITYRDIYFDNYKWLVAQGPTKRLVSV